MDSSTWVDELSALNGFMNNIETRLDVAAASTTDAKMGGEHGSLQRDDELAVLASRNSDSAVSFKRARAQAAVASSEAKTEVLALMLRVMDDDGRRHYSDQPVDTSGMGLDGPFGNEYRAFFSELESSTFDMASTKVLNPILSVLLDNESSPMHGSYGSFLSLLACFQVRYPFFKIS